MRISRLAVTLLIFLWSVVGRAQGPGTRRLNDLATAISHAEGFGKRGTIPTRYHNPGDLKASPGSDPLAGQVRIGKAGHIVFKDDEAGKAALRDCILKMMDGRSAYFNAEMTLNQVARVYAKNWRPWVKIVSTELGVPANTTLRAYFHDGVVPSGVRFRPLSASTGNPTPLPPLVSFPESRSVLDAVLDIPVDVPPLVEDLPQHRKFKLLHSVRYQQTRCSSGVTTTTICRL